MKTSIHKRIFVPTSELCVCYCYESSCKYLIWRFSDGDLGKGLSDPHRGDDPQVELLERMLLDVGQVPVGRIQLILFITTRPEWPR